jgi:maleylpyruvate isomerase
VRAGFEEGQSMGERTDVVADLAACREAHARLLATVAALSDAQAHAPSRLPGWTVGHVLTHIARHAESVTRRLAASARGEVIDQYEGGMAGRVAGIDAGASRTAAELVIDVRVTASALEEAMETMPPDAWDGLTRGVAGDLQPAWLVAHRRIREVEIHHTDLGLGYEAGSWPSAMVDEMLAAELPALAGRVDRHELLAWIIGRGEAPELPSW